MSLEITDSIFEDQVLKSDKPVLVDFWAPWCGPCLTLGPTIDEIADEYQDKAIVGKINVDINQTFAGKYGIRSIPTVILFHNGTIIGRFVGISPKEVFTNAIDTVLST